MLCQPGTHVPGVVTGLEKETRIGKGETTGGQLSRRDLVVLDDLRYLPFARSGGEVARRDISSPD